MVAGGLTGAEVRERLERDGPNVMPSPRPPSPLGTLAALVVPVLLAADTGHKVARRWGDRRVRPA